MSSSYTPILVGVVSLVLEIPQPSKTDNFPFRTMDYSPWSSEYLIDQNQMKKFMQVDVDVTCMCTNFGGRGLFGFGDTATLKTANFPFWTMDYSPWSPKISIDWIRLKKFMQIRIDVKFIHTNFGGCGLFGFGDTATLKNGQFSLSDHGL